jgi:uncharacterized protein (DUF2342 family)
MKIINNVSVMKMANQSMKMASNNNNGNVAYEMAAKMAAIINIINNKSINGVLMAIA